MNYHRVIPLVLAAAVLLAGFAGCSREPGPEVWVIGLDGADWDQLEPMMARGELPHLAGLRDGGAWGILRSDMPMISPLLWTSIATGKAPDVHGVTWFMTDAADGSKMPISSYERKVRTFWSIASEADLTCGIVGWWATWPADPVNGWLVSDYVAWHSFGVTGRSSVDQGKTWPPDLMDLVNEVMPSPMDIPDSELMRMVHLPATALMPDPGADPYADPPAHLRQAMATSRGYTDLVLNKLGTDRPRLMSVYFEGTDAVTHLFGDFQPPRLPWVSEADFAAYKDVVDEYWKWQDALLGELLAKRGPQTTVMVVSDHGFRLRDERRKEDEFHTETADADHMLDGVVIINGPEIQSGTRITGAEIYDVAPTVLHLLDLAVGSDMKGHVLADAFTRESRNSRQVRVVATYETSPLVRAQEATGDKEARANLEKMLRSLGYIAGGARIEGVASHSPEQAVNLATVLMRQEREDEAVVMLREALDAHPGHQEIRLNLAQALARSGDLTAAENIFEGLLSESPERLEFHQDLAICRCQAGNFEGALGAIDAGLEVKSDWVEGLTARGWYLFKLDRAQEGKMVLEKAILLDPRYDRAHFNLGRILAEQGDLQKAVLSLERAHELDPGSRKTALSLAGVLEQQDHHERALVILTRTLELGGEDPRVLGRIGAVLIRSGRPGEAIAPLSQSWKLVPDNTDVLGNLGMAYAMTGNLPAAINSFEKVVALAPDLADGHGQLGSLYSENKQSDQAVAELKKATAQDPDNPGFHLNLGTAYHQSGKVDLARKAYRQAIRLNPELAPAYYNLGLLERSQGNAAEGRDLISRARQLDPSLPER